MRAGALGEFLSPDELLAAVRAMKERGYTALDTFTPFPIDGMEEELGLRRSIMNWIAFPAAIGGAGLAFLVQWYTVGWNYPLDVGGRPPSSIPAFIPITFELGVLAASLTAFFGLFALLRLPWLSSPVFDVEGFERATIDRFFLGVSARDPQFDEERTRRDLEQAGAVRVAFVQRRSVR